MLVERIGSDVRVHPRGALNGEVGLPGAKSLTHRHLVCAALAHGRSTLRNVSDALDNAHMLRGLQALAVTAQVLPDRIDLAGCGGAPPATEAQIDCGEAGVVLRTLLAVSCLGYGLRELDGAPRLRERPLAGLIDALRTLGGSITPDVPPLQVVAHGLSGGNVELAALESSQFVSALLLVGPYCTEDLLLHVSGSLPSRPYVDMTMRVMREHGVETLDDGERRFIVPAAQSYGGGDFEIEPDASSATYFWGAAAVTGGAVRVRGLTRASCQGDVGFVDLLERMGCLVREDAGGLTVAGAAGGLAGLDVDMNRMPDAVPTLAVVALFARGPTTIRNVAHLRHKESDRLTVLARELTRLGAEVVLRADGLTIHPPARPHGAEIYTYNDHRMAMSFALAGLVLPGVVIHNAGCVAKSFPQFFETLNTLAW